MMMPSTLPVLTFHNIDERPSVISISPKVFKHSMERLRKRGYRALSLRKVRDILKCGEPFPDRCFGITFDDGHRSVYTEAFSVLQDYGMSATVFLTVGESSSVRSTGSLPSLNGRPMLSWYMIREMHRWGIEFGAHTCTHPDLTRISIDHVKTEISESKMIIEDALGESVSCFAYPYGRYNRRIRNIVQKYFLCASSDKLGLINQNSDLYALERVDAYYLRTDRLFQIMSTEIFPWYILACSIPRRIRRAIQPNLDQR